MRQRARNSWAACGAQGLDTGHRVARVRTGREINGQDIQVDGGYIVSSFAGCRLKSDSDWSDEPASG